MGNVTVLNFDQALRHQGYTQQPAFEQIEMSDISQTNGYCARESLKRVENRLRRRRNRGITLLGRGNYHYVSYLLLTEIKRPFTLVLFDHHHDMMPSPDVEHISCGSWVYQALKHLPNLRKVVLLGVSEEAAASIPVHCASRTVVISEEEIKRGVSERKLMELIGTDLIYVSIDKDVLAESEVVTDWDQGSLTIRELVAYLDAVSRRGKIAGADICGEYSVDPMHAWRDPNRQAVKRNERANRLLVERIRYWMKQHTDTDIRVS